MWEEKGWRVNRRASEDIKKNKFNERLPAVISTEEASWGSLVQQEHVILANFKCYQLKKGRVLLRSVTDPKGLKIIRQQLREC